MTQCKAYTSLKRVEWVGRDQFIIHKRELIESESWKTMSINCFRLISFLELCFMNNAGEENGYYIATYNQLVSYGIRKHSIKKAIDEAYKRGLIRYTLSDAVGKYGKFTYLFRLTYLPQTVREGNKRYYLPPSNEWKYCKKASDGNDTNISDESVTNESIKTGKTTNSISDESVTTIYI